MGRRSHYEPKDPLFHKAREQGYHSRAAFKLLEIHQKLKIFAKGDWVIDLGAAPGSWAQVACKAVGQAGRIIGIDLDPVKIDETLPADSCFFFQGDIRGEETAAFLRDTLQGKKVSWVLSDLSPKLSGIAARDQTASLELAQMALQVARLHLRKGGGMIIKVFPGPDLETFRKEMAACFTTQKLLQLDATRKTSKEIYLVGKDFKSISN